MYSLHDPGIIKYGRQNMEHNIAIKPVTIFIACCYSNFWSIPSSPMNNFLK